MLRISASRKAGSDLLETRPFGRRRILEAGGPKERGGPRMAVNLEVSGREFQDFRGQLADAKRFLRRHGARLRTLMKTPGVWSASLDFGVADEIDGGRGKAVVMYFRFPADLVMLVGAIGIDLELSVYPIHRRMTRAGLR